MHNFPKIFYFVDSFNKEELKNLNKKIGIIYRNYKKVDFSEINRLRIFCKEHGKKLFLANNASLAFRLRLNGVYIPSFNKNLRLCKYKNYNNFQIIGSAHNIKEIVIKKLQGVKFLFIAPLFKTQKSQNFLEIYRFKILKKIAKLQTFALGGINKKNIKRIKLTECYGFASISYIKNNIIQRKIKH